jgi:hypothetical protein
MLLPGLLTKPSGLLPHQAIKNIAENRRTEQGRFLTEPDPDHPASGAPGIQNNQTEKKQN